MFPSFKVFTEFIVKEANIACDQVTSLQALKLESQADEGKPAFGDRGRRRLRGASSFSTEVTEMKKIRPGIAPLHGGKSGHGLGDCRIFLNKTLEERKQIIWDNGLCFGCLQKGHMSKSCK